MATTRQPATSGSNCSDGDERYAIYDEKKRKRMISNRDSARRSRMKKQQHMEQLNVQILQLENENKLISEKINATFQSFAVLASENDVLGSEIAALTDRLRSLNCVIEIAAEANGIAVDVPDIPDSSLEPWKLPCPIHPIMVSAHMHQF